MSVILLILKIIGIMLLVLVGLILTLALLVVFLPVRYRVTGSIAKEWQVGLKVNASWLFHIIFLQFRQREKESTAFVRIFGIPIRLFPKKEKAGKKEKKNKEKKTKQKKTREAKNRKTKNRKIKNEDAMHKEAKHKEENDIENQSIASGDVDIVSEIQPEQEAATTEVAETMATDEQANTNARHRIDLFARIKRLWHRFLQMLTSIKNTAKNLRKSVHHIFTRAGSIKEMILDETNRKASQLILKELLYVLGHYKPRKIKSKLAFSLGDPAMTGQVLGALSVLPIMYRYQIEVYPDFVDENLYVEGTFSISGRIRMIHLIRSAIHIWRDENTKHLIGQIRA